MRRSSGTPALRSMRPFCTSIAQRTASTTLRNSTIASVAGAFDDAAVMRGDGRVDKVAAEAPKTRKRAVLVGAGEPAITDDIRNQDRRELPSLAHCFPPAAGILS